MILYDDCGKPDVKIEGLTLCFHSIRLGFDYQLTAPAVLKDIYVKFPATVL
jgi:hypothetical protein